MEVTTGKDQMFIEELTAEEKIVLDGAMKEHSSGRTISLAEAERALGI